MIGLVLSTGGRVVHIGNYRGPARWNALCGQVAEVGPDPERRGHWRELPEWYSRERAVDLHGVYPGSPDTSLPVCLRCIAAYRGRDLQLWDYMAEVGQCIL